MSGWDLEGESTIREAHAARFEGAAKGEVLL
jgi:hypothetical protein